MGYVCRARGLARGAGAEAAEKNKNVIHVIPESRWLERRIRHTAHVTVSRARADRATLFKAPPPPPLPSLAFARGARMIAAI